jgi:tetratricopeptide (TPR) repeat protein
MAENIPSTLIDRMRAGRAGLVVGTAFGALAGLPSWKKVLEKLRETLEHRGRPGDKEAAEDLQALIKKGRFASAIGFLSRTLGNDSCDAILRELWRTPAVLPDAVKALGRLPAKAVWTTFPTDLVDRALAEGSPPGWPLARSASYDDAGQLNTRQRYIIKALGQIDDGSYVVVPSSLRKALPTAVAYRSILEDLYRDGALLFLGFRHGDPDLTAILDRVLGGFEPPSVDHYFASAGLGPVDTEELHSEHRLSVIPLAGQGGDEKSAESLVDFLKELADACEHAGVSLTRVRPADDDLEGWLARLEDDHQDSEALGALDQLEASVREGGNPERLVEVLMGRVEIEVESERRASILREVANIFEKDVGDLPRAFTALTAALREDPADEDTAAAAERLALETDGWAELVADLSEVVPEIEDKKKAAIAWTRLGRWYHERLRHDDYAIASLREAIKLDGERLDARERLEELYRKAQRWGDLAEELASHAEVEHDPERKVDVLLGLGDLYETQLASTSKAIEAYERARLADADNGDALGALERLYRRGERWGLLLPVLEKRAELLTLADPGRAASYRKELASLRSDKLGDVEGAIGRYEAALAADERDLEALRALEKLYDKVGRSDDYQRVLERLAELAPDGERAATWRRLAAEVEDREGGLERAARYYENVLAIEPAAIDAFRSLERLQRARGDWDAVVRVLERQIAATTTPAPRVDLWASLGRLHEQELADPHRAIEAWSNALEISPEHREALQALARLYRRVEAYDRAAETLVKHAELDGPRGAERWHEAGALAAKELGDPQIAEQRFEKALELEAGFAPARAALVELYRKRFDWARAAQALLEGEKHTQNRLDRVRYLWSAANLYEGELDQPERALELYAKILQLDPEHVEAGQRAAEAWVGQGKWAQAEPVLEMLARKVEVDDRVERGRREALLGRCYVELGLTDKAQKRLRAAVEADPESLEAALGLAGLLFDGHQLDDAEKRLREILLRHRTSLAEGQTVDIWYKLGLICREKSDAKGAEQAFRTALEKDPGYRPALVQLIELASARGDWKTVAQAKRNQLEGASDDDRARLFEEMGDLSVQRLQDPVSALGAYLEALTLKPRSFGILHKTLELYTEQKQWRRAVETLTRLAELEKDPARRAKYFYAAAVITRDEMKELDEAVDFFSHALDDAPTMSKAFEAVERILGDRGDWKGLQRAYRKMIKRLGEAGTESQLLPLWTRLGEIAHEKLGDTESAIAAFEVACNLEPENVKRHEQLARLYLVGGAGRAEQAISELQVVLKAHPDRLDLYKSLSRLYVDTNQIDKAFCLAAALVVLGQASDEERGRYQALRPKTFAPARRRLTEELWQKNVMHAREDRAVSGLYAALMAPLAATTAQPLAALDLAAKDRVDLEKDGRLAAKAFRYAVGLLGLTPQPDLFLRGQDKEGIRVANTADKNVLAPAVVVGEPYLASPTTGARQKNEREVLFDLGKKLAFFRPERYVYFALPTLPRLETALAAAMLATGVSQRDAQDPEADKLAGMLKRTVPGTVLEQLAPLARRLAPREGDGLVTGWVTATDLTANRVGLIVADDLETAARQVATEQAVHSTMGAKDRLRELLAFACSEEYFAVRRHLGQDISGGGLQS